MKNISCFLFDMGGTVLDFHASQFSDIELEAHGLNNSKAAIRNIFKTNGIDDIDQMVFKPWFDYINSRRKVDLIEQRIDEILYKYLLNKGFVADYNFILSILTAHFSMYAKNVIISNGFVELAEYLRKTGKRLGIISNIPYPDEIFIDIFKRLNLHSLFDVFIFSYSNVFMKPHESMFFKALMRLGIEPSKALMIGDNYNADIEGARNIGMKTCFYDPKMKYEGYDADFHISNFEELLEIVKEES